MSDPDATPLEISALIDEHYTFVFGFLYRLCGSRADAEDLTQQTFLSAHSNLGQLRDSRKARGWLCTIGRNAFLKLVTKRKTSSVNLDSLPEVAQETNSDTEIDGEQLQSLLNQMPEEFRSTVVLFYYESCSYREIAERMDIPIGTVMSRLARAKAWLRRRLGAVRGEQTSAEQN
ncbi:MAG: RNA polymerase sigma factor [Planctomycetaceae bacterium]